MDSIKEIITINKAKFWINSQNILFCEFKNTESYLTLGVDTVEKYEKAIDTLLQGKAMPFIIDVRDSLGNFSTEAAKFFANSSFLKNARISEAFVINSIKSKLLINSYKRIFEPNTPFEIFKDFDEALAYSINSKKIFDASN